MIIDKHNLIFIHIPKTAGTTIVYSLIPKNELDLGGGPIMNLDNRLKVEYGLTFSLKHGTAQEIKYYVGTKKWSQYYKFAIIRNPWDRTVSAYHWIQHHNKNFKDLSFSEYVDLIPKNINAENHPLYRQLRTQCSFIKSNNNIIVDELFQFEKLQECFHVLKSKFGIEKDEHKNYKINPNRKSYQEYYTKRMSNIIEEYYQDDIQLFDYKFEPL